MLGGKSAAELAADVEAVAAAEVAVGLFDAPVDHSKEKKIQVTTI